MGAAVTIRTDVVLVECYQRFVLFLDALTMIS